MAGAAGAVAVIAAGLPTSSAPRDQGWRVYQTVHTTNAGLNDVVAISGKDAWAAGSAGSSTPVVYKWNGRSWKPIARPGRSGSSAASIAASSYSNVWVAISSEAAVDHWNGRAWSRVSFGAPARVEIDGLTTTGRKDVWAFGYDNKTKTQTAFHWNGSSWKDTRLPASLGGGASARLASASSRSDVWAWAYDANRGGWVSLHYNGRKWKVIALPAALLPAGHTVLPEQMLAKSRHDVWGTVYAAKGNTHGPAVLLHWNGQHWRRIGGKLPAGSLTGPIAPDGHGGLWLAGEQPGGTAYLTHYARGRWTQTPVPAGHAAVTALALVPGSQTLWGAGVLSQGFGTSRGSVILRYSN